MLKIIKLHWRGEDGFWRTCLLNGIAGGLMAFPATFLFVLALSLALAKFGAPRHLLTWVITLCVVIPSLLYMIWLYIGMFRYGLRILGDKKSTALQTSGGVIAILLVVICVGESVIDWSSVIKHWPPSIIAARTEASPGSFTSQP